MNVKSVLELVLCLCIWTQRRKQLMAKSNIASSTAPWSELKRVNLFRNWLFDDVKLSSKFLLRHVNMFFVLIQMLFSWACCRLSDGFKSSYHQCKYLALFSFIIIQGSWHFSGRSLFIWREPQLSKSFFMLDLLYVFDLYAVSVVNLRGIARCTWAQQQILSDSGNSC